MSAIAIDELGGNALIGLGNLIGFWRSQSTDAEINKLYWQTDGLAVLVVKQLVAFLWWASHIASAAADQLGYSAQIQAALAKADIDMFTAWAEFLDVKYPADLRKLYSQLTADIDNAVNRHHKTQQPNLKRLLAEVAALVTWKNKVATPELNQWKQFHLRFDKTYVPPLRTLIKWTGSPKTLADFVLPAIIPGLVTALGKPGYKRQATKLEQELMATWVNGPDVILDNFYEWLLAK